jgi:hypothetical protein
MNLNQFQKNFRLLNQFLFFEKLMKFQIKSLNQDYFRKQIKFLQNETEKKEKVD